VFEVVSRSSFLEYLLIFNTISDRMKIKASIKRKDLAQGDQIVKRRGKIYRINKKNPRRKARQG